MDAENVQQLVQKLGVYTAKQIRLLTDAQATRQGILDGLDWLASGSQPGDNVFFYYSGHGAQISDPHNDEPDGLEETLCPVETTMTRKEMITDDEINERLQRLSGRHVLVVIDSCHSGTISKGQLPKGVQLKIPTFATPLPETKGISSEPLISSSAHAQGKTVVFSAVASNQSAIDTRDGGVFTSSFVKAIEERRGKISNRELLEITRRASEEACQLFSSASRLGLTPQLYSERSSLEFFSYHRPT